MASLAGHEVLGIGLASQPVREWRGRYVQMNVATSDLSNVIKRFEPEVVVHAAGSASVSNSLASPLDDLKSSALTWANTLDGIRRSSVRPLVLFPSSAAVYGNPMVLPVREDAPVAPISPYGFHKAACELLAREYAECFGLKILVCRLFSVFGPAQRRLLIWELFEQFAGDAEIVWLRGTGEESRDYLHIDDVTTAFLALAENSISETGTAESSSGYCRFINVASGTRINVLDLAESIRKLAAPEKKIRSRGIASAADPKSWEADIGLLHSLAPQWQPAEFGNRLSECIATWKKEAGL